MIPLLTVRRLAICLEQVLHDLIEGTGHRPRGRVVMKPTKQIQQLVEVTIGQHRRDRLAAQGARGRRPRIQKTRIERQIKLKPKATGDPIEKPVDRRNGQPMHRLHQLPEQRPAVAFTQAAAAGVISQCLALV